MHKMEEYWGSDCDDFFPARWIEGLVSQKLLALSYIENLKIL